LSSKPEVAAGWRRGEWAVIAVGLAAFLSLAVFQLWLPGLHYDEAKEAGLPAMQLLRGLPVDAFRGAGIRLGTTTFPLMVVDYIGATNVVLALPFLAIGGANVVALRLLPVLLSALSLVLLYLLGRELYSRRVAAIAFLLLAVNPSFVFWSRQGIFVTSTVITLSLGATLCLARWQRRGGRSYLWAGCFLLGFGLYTKLIFLWFVVALAFVFVLYQALSVLRGRRAFRRPLMSADLAGSGIAFGLGLLPFILYNMQTGGTVGVIGQNLATSYYGTNNLAFLQNFSTRLAQLRAVLTGGHLWYLGGIYENLLWPWAGVVVFLATAIVATWRARDELRRIALPWLVWAIIIPVSCFTVSALWPTHYAILTPWPPLAVAVGLDLVCRRGGWGRWARPVTLLLLAMIAALGVADVRVDALYHQALARSGGQAGHTSAIYGLAESLDRERLIAPVAMDWGLAAPVEFLTEGRIRPIEVFGYEWNDSSAFQARLSSFLGNPDTVYVFHSPAETVFPRRDAFDALVAQRGAVTQTEQVIRQPDGKPVFMLVRVKRAP
jgi:hypothetical protein